MWSYEIVYHHPDLTKGTVKEQVDKNCLQYKDTSETVVAEDPKDVLDSVKKRLEFLPDWELVGIIRRHPIVTIMKKQI